MKTCINLENGQLFGWTEALAKRPDFITYQHPLKRDLGPVTRHEPQERLDVDPQRIDASYENSAPDHMVPFTLVAERFPQFFYDRNSNILELRGLFRTGVLAGCLYVCGGRAYLGLAETIIALDRAQKPIAEYSEFHKQTMREAMITLQGAPARAIEGCNQRLAVAQEKADSAQGDVDDIRSEVEDMDILGKDFSMDRLVAIRRDFKKATNKLATETKLLQSAQADLASAQQQLKPVQASDGVPDFKAPSQKTECARLNVSERHFRDLFDSFKIDHDIDSLRWANLTKAQYEKFCTWLDAREAA